MEEKNRLNKIIEELKTKVKDLNENKNRMELKINELKSKIEENDAEGYGKFDCVVCGNKIDLEVNRVVKLDECSYYCWYCCYFINIVDIIIKNVLRLVFVSVV